MKLIMGKYLNNVLNKKLYKCEFCGIYFEDKEKCNLHEIKKHLAKKHEKVFIYCETCGIKKPISGKVNAIQLIKFHKSGRCVFLQNNGD